MTDLSACPHESSQHRFVVRRTSDEPAVYDGSDRSEAVEHLVRLREARDPVRLGFVQVRVLPSEPPRWCPWLENEIDAEVEERVPLPPREDLWDFAD